MFDREGQGDGAVTGGMDWQGRVGDMWAAEWRRTDRSLSDLSRHLDTVIAGIAPAQGDALDIGCGAGASMLALHRACPDLRITGVDLSPQLADRARARMAGQGAEVLRFLCDDAVAVAEREGPFDLFVSRHGVMFFPDPVLAFARLRNAAREGATMVFSCFGQRGDNAFAMVADAVLGVSPVVESGYRPGPFAFADPDAVAAWMTRAGWGVEDATRVPFEYVVGEGDDPVEDALSFLSRIGPAARGLAQAMPRQRARLEDGLRQALAGYRRDARVVLPASAWIWRLGTDRGIAN